MNIRSTFFPSFHFLGLLPGMNVVSLIIMQELCEPGSRGERDPSSRAQPTSSAIIYPGNACLPASLLACQPVYIRAVNRDLNLENLLSKNL